MQLRAATVDRVDTIEDFGTLSGRLADPFCDREAVLASASLTEPLWEDLQRSFGLQLERAAASPSTLSL